MDDTKAEPRLRRMRSVDLRWVANTGPTVIVVDESTLNLEQAQNELRVVGVTARPFARGSSALVELGRAEPDAVLIAADVTHISCVEWIRAVRESTQIPILVGVRAEQMHVAGPVLMAGATAVVEYPFSPSEVVDELQREWESVPTRNVTRRQLRAGPLELDASSFTAKFHGAELRLTLGSFELLWCLMLRAGRVVSAEEISRSLGRPESPPGSTAFVKTQVARLRSEVGDREIVQTVRGQGYTLRHLLGSASENVHSR